MIAIISPAKKLDFESKPVITQTSSPDLLTESEKLIAKLRTLNAKKIAKLMDLSPALSELNYERYQNWSNSVDLKTGKQAILAFKGDVYLGLDVEQYSERNFKFAQQHLRILSGLYGVLRPLDVIQPYRLEMGTKLQVGKSKNLYDFWGKTITNKLNDLLEKEGSSMIVNLASGEYFKSVKSKDLKAEVIECQFKENKNGIYKPVMIFAKKARGLMSSFIIKNELVNSEDLKAFDEEGYVFNPKLSEEKNLVFTRG